MGAVTVTCVSSYADFRLFDFRATNQSSDVSATFAHNLGTGGPLLPTWFPVDVTGVAIAYAMAISTDATNVTLSRAASIASSLSVSSGALMLGLRKLW